MFKKKKKQEQGSQATDVCLFKNSFSFSGFFLSCLVFVALSHSFIVTIVIPISFLFFFPFCRV